MVSLLSRFSLAQLFVIFSSLYLPFYSTGDLVLFFMLLVFILVLLFAFIFTGVGAFTAGSTFESVVNSIITALAGVLVGVKGGKGKEERMYELKQSVNRVLNILKKAI